MLKTTLKRIFYFMLVNFLLNATHESIANASDCSGKKINQAFRELSTSEITPDQLAQLHNESYSSNFSYYCSLTDKMEKIRRDILAIVLLGKKEDMVSLGPQSIRDQNLESLPLSSRILDVGCGLGDNLVLMAELGFKELTGVDVAKGLLQAAKKTPAEIVCADILHYQKDAYDLVFAQAFIHLFPKNMIKGVLSHLLSLSKKRCYFSTTLHDIPSEDIELKKDVMRYRSRYTLQEILSLARKLLDEDPHLSFHYFILEDPLGKLWINGIFERRDIGAIYKKDGILIYKQFIYPEAIQPILAEIDSFKNNKAQPGTYLRYDSEKIFDRLENFLPFCSRELREMLQNEKSKMIIDLFLGERTILFKDKINFKLPGMGAFVPHQDAAAGWEKYGDKHLTFCLSFDESTNENGALFFSCGNHTKGLLGPLKAPLDQTIARNLEWIQVTTKPGDAIFFDSYTPPLFRIQPE